MERRRFEDGSGDEGEDEEQNVCLATEKKCRCRGLPIFAPKLGRGGGFRVSVPSDNGPGRAWIQWRYLILYFKTAIGFALHR